MLASNKEGLFLVTVLHFTEGKRRVQMEQRLSQASRYPCWVQKQVPGGGSASLVRGEPGPHLEKPPPKGSRAQCAKKKKGGKRKEEEMTYLK